MKMKKNDVFSISHLPVIQFVNVEKKSLTTPLINGIYILPEGEADKGKPAEKLGRKTSGPRIFVEAGLPKLMAWVARFFLLPY